MDKNQSNIPEFTGSSYTTWALKIQYGLSRERLISAVCDFKGRPRTTCLDRINPLAQGVLLLLPMEEREDARNAHNLDMVRNDESIQKWLDMDLDAQSFRVKFMGDSEQIHIRGCDTAHEMWTNLKIFYEFQGDIEVANAQAKLSTIVMGETEEISVYVRRLQAIHDLLTRLNEPVSPAKQATNQTSEPHRMDCICFLAILSYLERKVRCCTAWNGSDCWNGLAPPSGPSGSDYDARHVFKGHDPEADKRRDNLNCRLRGLLCLQVGIVIA